jgi:hypothetical protein
MTRYARTANPPKALAIDGFFDRDTKALTDLQGGEGGTRAAGG